MASYEIEFKPSVGKDLRALPTSVIARVIERIESLAEEPFPHGTTKLRGAERHYRLRVGDYRIVYEVDTASKVITIQHVRHRREAYRES